LNIPPDTYYQEGIMRHITHTDRPDMTQRTLSANAVQALERRRERDAYRITSRVMPVHHDDHDAWLERDVTLRVRHT